jgi:hypothetical protein
LGLRGLAALPVAFCPGGGRMGQRNHESALAGVSAHGCQRNFI